jgi:acyl-CoA reductase-like NAD-dependent aldehyde dehydrogenase
LSFVGSSATGKKLMVAAGETNMKRLLLECGGKSPYLVFDDCPADLDFMAADIVETAFPNQGALCVAGSRLLIQENMRDKLMDKIIEQTKLLQPADPLNVDTTFGALINQGHLEKVQGYLQSGIDQGAKLLCGGERVMQDTGGYYFTPAVLDAVGPKFKVAQEEIFGPVLSVLTFKDEAEAIKLANDSSFGLSSYLASTDVSRIHRVGKKIQSGSMMVFSTNRLEGGNVPIYSEAHKESGFGRRGGQEGLLAYSAGTTMYLYHD